MNLYYLDFEQPIAELEEKIEELRLVGSDQELNIQEVIERLEHEREIRTKDMLGMWLVWRAILSGLIRLII